MVDMLSHGLIDAAFFVVELAGLYALLVGLVRAIARASELETASSAAAAASSQ